MVRTRTLVAAAATTWLVATGLAACGPEPQASPTPDAPTSARPSAPVADGERLLYSRFDEATHTFLSTHVSRPDGADAVEVPMPGPEGGGRWSRAGAEIAVMTLLEDGRVGTAVISPDGEKVRVLDIPDPTLNLVCTVWWPDDSRLACEGWDDGDPSRTGIYAVRASDGGGLRRLTTPPSGLADLPGDVAPDGRTVLFKRGSGEQSGTLMVVPGRGGEARLFAGRQVEDPGRFSPDGRRVLTSHAGAVVVLDQSGGLVGSITVPGRFLFGPVWSPDGSRIAYSAAGSGTGADLFTSRPDGSGRHQVTDTPDNEIVVEWGAAP